MLVEANGFTRPMLTFSICLMIPHRYSHSSNVCEMYTPVIFRMASAENVLAFVSARLVSARCISLLSPSEALRGMFYAVSFRHGHMTVLSPLWRIAYDMGNTSQHSEMLPVVIKGRGEKIALTIECTWRTSVEREGHSDRFSVTSSSNNMIEGESLLSIGSQPTSCNRSAQYLMFCF